MGNRALLDKILQKVRVSESLHKKQRNDAQINKVHPYLEKVTNREIQTILTPEFVRWDFFHEAVLFCRN